MSTRKDYENLTALGYTGAMSDMKEKWLIDQGYDSINAYLKGQGYTGATSDMIKQLATFNGYASVNEFLRDVGLYGVGSVSFYPVTLNQSLRFNDNDSAYLSRTFPTAGNRKTWTYSTWVKRGNISLDTNFMLEANSGDGFNRSYNYFSAANEIVIGDYTSVWQWQLKTNALYRDPSAWYHIVVAVDTTQATASDRIKLYVNGEQITSLAAATYPSQNYNTYINSVMEHTIGYIGYAGQRYFDGYLAEAYFCDGTAYTADDFGEFKNGVWVAKTPSVTYGTNGFYLPFDDAGFLGQSSVTVLGTELVTNGTFDTDTTGWSVKSGSGTTISVDTQRLKVYTSNNDGYCYAFQTITTEAGKKYEFSTDLLFSNATARHFYIRIGTSENDSSLAQYFTASGNYGKYVVPFTATGTTTYIQVMLDTNGSGQYILTDNITTKEVTAGGNWSSTNLAATDQMLDSPTNNFATLNPLWKNVALPSYGEASLSEGNLKATCVPGGSHRGNTISISSGKYYYEILCNNWINSISAQLSYGGTSSQYQFYDGGIKINGSLAGTYATVRAGDIVGVAVDRDNDTVSFYKNGTLQYTGTSLTSGEIEVRIYVGSTGEAVTVNFGQDSSFAGAKTPQDNTDANGIGDFYYPVPEGALALCSSNLPAVDTAIFDGDTINPSDHFNTVLYSGNGTNPRTVTGVGFEPNFLWIKGRSDPADYHFLLDSVRGADKVLKSNATDAEYDGGGTGYQPSFDADGFSLTANSLVNGSGNTYVAWCFKAGGAPVANTDGTIASQVSANTAAGFSIVSYNASATGTVGHGLSQAPEVRIYKDRDAVDSWYTYWEVLGATNRLQLNQTAAAVSGDNLVTSTTISNVMGASGNNIIAYCFHSVPNMSKVGKYIGNGSADGPFVYLGFRPSFVLYKRAIGGTGNWILADNKREGYNWDNPVLYPNLANAESGSSSIDMYSNGFKVNNSVAGVDHNASGSTYIYIAFAENPFKYSNAR